MSQDLLQQHETLVIDVAHLYLDNMELELGKKYKNRSHEINVSLSDIQQSELTQKHNISMVEFSELYAEFKKMKPTKHLKQALDAFTASGGNIDIEPSYNETTQRLNVVISYVIKDKTYETIEGLSALEAIIMQMNAMLQVDTVLSGSNSAAAQAF